jgi:hypothetical protein
MARIDLILRYKSRVFTNPARCAHRSAEQGPLWGCDRVGVRKPAFVPVRRQPATGCGCGCDPLAEGPLAGADAMRPASRISIAALCAPSRTGASRTGSGGGCDPLAEGPFAGADALRPVSPMPIAALCAPSRTGATRTGSGGGCDPLAEGPFAGAAALRPVSPMPIAALCAPSRTGASRTGSGAHPRARGAPHGGRGAPCMGI